MSDTEANSPSSGNDSRYRDLSELGKALERGGALWMRRLTIVLRAAVQTAGAPCGRLFVRAPGDRMRLAVVLHPDGTAASSEQTHDLSPAPERPSPAMRALLTGQVIRVADFAAADMDGAAAAAFLGEHGLIPARLLVLPLRNANEQVVAAIEIGNPRALDDAVLNALAALAEDATASLAGLDMYDRVVATGLALAEEQDPNALPERVVAEAMLLSSADGAILYLLGEDGRLTHSVVRIASLGLELGGATGVVPAYPGLATAGIDGGPDRRRVAVCCALDKAPIHVADAELSPDFSFTDSESFDALAGYRTMAVFAVPLIDRRNRTLGVLELLNPHDPLTGLMVGFNPHTRAQIESLALRVSVNLDRQRTAQRMIDTGISLSAERDHDRLMERILLEAKELCNAEGGTLYLRTEDNTLAFKSVHNDVLGIAMGGKTGKPIAFKPLAMYDEAGQPNHRNVATHVALSGEAVNIVDAYEVAEFDFAGTRNFDKSTGYRSKSFLTVPLKDRKNEVIGVLQLINARETRTNTVVPFGRLLQPQVESLASQAAVALNNQLLLDAQKKLLDSFIELIAGAIDAKSPYTGGHCQRVPALSMIIMEEVCKAEDGPFKDVRLSEEEMYEVSISALLHDCGKVTTPEYVVDKATKLETIYNRIHEVRMRFEVLKRDAVIDYLRALLKGEVPAAELDKALEERLAKIDEDFAFVAEANVGGEFMAPEKVERIKQIAGQTWKRTLSDRLGLSHVEMLARKDVPEPALPVDEPLLADKIEHVVPWDVAPSALNPKFGFKIDVPKQKYNFGEVYNLAVARGTLTAEERFKINEHVIQSIVMLEQLPFPKHLKRVPEYAGGHHETLIGTGYPRKLSKEEMSIPARIMAIADVFEALTASDRPYKKAKTLSEAIKILFFMKKDKHVDPDLFDLFLTSGAYKRYAERFLGPEQIDEVDVSKFIGPIPEAPKK